MSEGVEIRFKNAWFERILLYYFNVNVFKYALVLQSRTFSRTSFEIMLSRCQQSSLTHSTLRARRGGGTHGRTTCAY